MYLCSPYSSLRDSHHRMAGILCSVMQRHPSKLQVRVSCQELFIFCSSMYDYFSFLYSVYFPISFYVNFLMLEIVLVHLWFIFFIPKDLESQIFFFPKNLPVAMCTVGFCFVYCNTKVLRVFPPFSYERNRFSVIEN